MSLSTSTSNSNAKPLEEASSSDSKDHKLGNEKFAGWYFDRTATEENPVYTELKEMLNNQYRDEQDDNDYNRNRVGKQIWRLKKEVMNMYIKIDQLVIANKVDEENDIDHKKRMEKYRQYGLLLNAPCNGDLAKEIPEALLKELTQVYSSIVQKYGDNVANLQWKEIQKLNNTMRWFEQYITAGKELEYYKIHEPSNTYGKDFSMRNVCNADKVEGGIRHHAVEGWVFPHHLPTEVGQNDLVFLDAVNTEVPELPEEGEDSNDSDSPSAPAVEGDLYAGCKDSFPDLPEGPYAGATQLRRLATNDSNSMTCVLMLLLLALCCWFCTRFFLRQAPKEVSDKTNMISEPSASGNGSVTITVLSY